MERSGVGDAVTYSMHSGGAARGISSRESTAPGARLAAIRENFAHGIVVEKLGPLKAIDEV
jgi:hypothetical protein